MEIHGYTQGGYIDATIDGLRMTVPDDLGNRHRQMIAEWEAAGGVIEPYVEPIAPTSYRLYKSTLVRRLTEQEAVTLVAVLDASPVKSKMLWDASEWLDSSDPLFADLGQAIGSALGEDRAAEILARLDPA